MSDKNFFKDGNKTNANISKSQTTISKFFNKSGTSFLNKRTVKGNDYLESSNKLLKLQSYNSKSERTKKYHLSKSTFTKLQSYSSKSNSIKCEAIEEISAEEKDYGKKESTSFSPQHLEVSSLEPLNPKEMLQITSTKYTPLEKQYLEFKNMYSDAILMIECGYKYKFFGHDAEIASRVLNIACFKSHNFMSATIPVQRLHFHVRRLVFKGYKVGVIKQTETPALKAAGDKKNALFSRELQALYTISTLIGEEFCTPECNAEPSNSDIYDPDFESNYLMCIFEVLPKGKRGCSIAVVAVLLSSGDFIYSSFEDESVLRNKLESCLHLLSPSEILVPCYLSKETEILINGYSFERCLRIEKVETVDFEYSTALENLSRFYAKEPSLDSGHIMQTILKYPAAVVSCLSVILKYLLHFKLESVLRNVVHMKLLLTDESMVLTSATMKGLEVTKNNSTHTRDKSLFWIMNKTSTKFGERLLKSWITKPLKYLHKIEERLDIITEIIHSESIIFKVSEQVLNKLPDLERILCSVFFQKCSCCDFLRLAKALVKIHTEFTAVTDKVTLEVESSTLRNMLFQIPTLLGNVGKYLSAIDPEAAKLGDKTKVFCDLSMFPELMKCKKVISSLEQKLNDYRPVISKTLKLFDIKYATVASQKFLVEVPNCNIALVPKDWLKVSSTKQVSRYRSPEIIQYCKEIDQQNELMIKLANEAWNCFLNDFGKNFYTYKQALSHLAELDCYLSFARVSKEEQFCRPLIHDTEDRLFNIIKGRHPVSAKLIEGKQFVANDINMNVANNCVIVTGPNMGGKSTYVRQTAAIALLAHVGCYVPAESATIPLFDNIYVRMGADDDLINRKSTFMVEMCESSEILNAATEKSFVVLDELGRGTSTNDGTAIAYSSLEYLIIDIKCFTMFVTHYPEILELKDCFPDKVSTVTMAYILKDRNEDSNVETVIFLYNVIKGISENSYGISVAALANIPMNILNKAHEISHTRKIKIEVIRRLKNLRKKIMLLSETNTASSS